MTVIHLKKKDVVKSSVKGVKIEFDHLNLASILGIPSDNGMREYIKDVWEESKYTKPLEITRRFANDETLMAARRVKSVDKKGEEPKRTDYFEETFLTMCKLRREDGVWWIGTGENRRRDDDDEAREAEAEEEDKDQTEFDWEAVIDEAAEQGESRSDDQFFDAQVDVEEPMMRDSSDSDESLYHPRFDEGDGHDGVDPSCPCSRIPEGCDEQAAAEFERARANRIQADLEKAHAENARLLAILQQAQFKSKP
ncbi:hypothetical protein Dimus_023215 [Dionaea muscipula]